MIAAPTFNQIKAQVSAMVKPSNGIALHSHSSRVIGIHAQGRWTGNRHQKDGDQSYVIDQCDSPLAFRIALQMAHSPQVLKAPKRALKLAQRKRFRC
ncbi:MAG: hypothetical protein HC800_20805 [Phormidesmis sp. RL_2_1]|nr:hypothetical protein [Phormidesmis sp. RL_2_1]